MQIFPSTLPVLGFCKKWAKIEDGSRFSSRWGWKWSTDSLVCKLTSAAEAVSFRNIAFILQETVRETQLLLHQVIAGGPARVSLIHSDGNWCCKRRMELSLYFWLKQFATDICNFFRNTLEPGMLHMTEESQLNMTIGKAWQASRL